MRLHTIQYRNGGLLVDLGVIEMKRPQLLEASFAVGSELVIEWRALTIALMDEMAVIIRKAYNATAETMPLVKILQVGFITCSRFCQSHSLTLWFYHLFSVLSITFTNTLVLSLVLRSVNHIH
jgi:hypothetical protein